MKIFGAINDGYRFIYSIDETIINDWLYINQEHFCILKIFALDIDDDVEIKQDNDLDINYSFDKRNIPQENYKKLMNENSFKNISVAFKDGLAYIIETEETNELQLELNYEEKLILKATRSYQKR